MSTRKKGKKPPRLKEPDTSESQTAGSTLPEPNVPPSSIPDSESDSTRAIEDQESIATDRRLPPPPGLGSDDCELLEICVPFLRQENYRRVFHVAVNALSPEESQAVIALQLALRRANVDIAGKRCRRPVVSLGDVIRYLLQQVALEMDESG